MGNLSGEQNPELLDVSEALEQILKCFSTPGITKIAHSFSLGFVLAEDIKSEIDVPSFTNSAMDGFAVRMDDISQASKNQPVVLDVVTDIPAGELVDIRLSPGQAARIMTGAVIPADAEAVVPVELTDFVRGSPGTAAPKSVKIYQKVNYGDNIRRVGEDISIGDIVLRKGERIRPQEIGLLSMIGVSNILVYSKPKIAIFSTGDELLPVDSPLTPGKIHDANTYSLIALIEKYGGDVYNLGIVPDDPLILEKCLDQALSKSVDLIVSSAGVSVGAYDYLREVINRYGKLNFWRVNMRPGKPVAFGEFRGIPFIGLPGNPVSAFIGFEVFVRPVILKLRGCDPLQRKLRDVRLLEPVHSDGRESYLRVSVYPENGENVVKLTGHQGSGNLLSLVQANALLLIPSGVKSLPRGAKAQAWMLDDCF